MLTAAQLAAREGKVTASFAPPLIAGNVERIANEYRGLIGDPSYVPDDFERDWALHLGSLLEQPMLDWFERADQHELTRRGEVVVHPTLPHVCCTLDAYRAHDQCVIDAKWIHGRMDLEDMVAYYVPQLVVQRACLQAQRAGLLVCHGGSEPSLIEIMLTPEYEATVFAVIAQFWHCVETLTPPVDLPQCPPPPERWRKVDLDSESPNWGKEMQEQLDLWQETFASAEQFGAAKERIKVLLPDDVGEVRQGDRLIKRARNRAVSIKLKPR